MATYAKRYLKVMIIGNLGGEENPQNITIPGKEERC
jgi:hypothetical protein